MFTYCKEIPDIQLIIINIADVIILNYFHCISLNTKKLNIFSNKILDLNETYVPYNDRCVF
jgi:hypothetical protein